MFDERTNLAQQVMAELKNFFGEKLCQHDVPRNIRLAEAPSHGKAALVYDPRSKGAESYIRWPRRSLRGSLPCGCSRARDESQAAQPRFRGAQGGEAAVEEIAAATAEMDKSA